MNQAHRLYKKLIIDTFEWGGGNLVEERKRAEDACIYRYWAYNARHIRASCFSLLRSQITDFLYKVWKYKLRRWRRPKVDFLSPSW